MKKSVTYGAVLVLVWLVGYKSVYFRKLDEHKRSEKVTVFDAKRVAEVYLAETLPALIDKPGRVPSAGVLMRLLETDPQSAVKKYSKSPSGGETAYFLVRDTALLASVDENTLQLKLDNGEKLALSTTYIFGNAVRDASGLIKPEDFTNTMDQNSVSEEINRGIKTTVIAPVLVDLKAGDRVRFAGAFGLNTAGGLATFKSSDIEIIPVQLSKLK